MDVDERRLFGYDVMDAAGNKIGDVDAMWVGEADGRVEFLAVKTGWLFGRNHIVPIRDAEIDETREVVQLPYHEDLVKEAPSIDPEREISPEEQAQVYSHFRLERGVRTPTGRPEAGMGQAEREAVEMPLHEEKVEIGKESVETGSVRLRKVVKTETINQPITLQKEEVHIERVPPGELKRRERGNAFQGEEIVLHEREERPVIDKRTDVIGGVRAEKEVETEREDVHATARREDVEVDRDEARGEREGPL